MTYEQAMRMVENKIEVKHREIIHLKECIVKLENDSKSNDELTQTSEQTLEHYSDCLGNLLLDNIRFL